MCFLVVHPYGCACVRATCVCASVCGMNTIFHTLLAKISPNLQCQCTWGQRQTDWILRSKINGYCWDRFSYHKTLNDDSLNWFSCVPVLRMVRQYWTRWGQKVSVGDDSFWKVMGTLVGPKATTMRAEGMGRRPLQRKFVTVGMQTCAYFSYQ